MPSVRLRYYEVEDRLLPPVCMKCGEPAALFVPKTFSSQEDAAFSLFGQRMKVHVPLCERHKNHWQVRSLAGWIGFGVVAFFGVASLGLMILLDYFSSHPQRNLNPVGGLACAGTVILGLAWLITIMVMQNSAIRATSISDRSITLTRVCHEFMDALEYQREQQPPQVPQRRRPPGYYDDDFDDDY
jgi:hypothetical protein